MPTPEVELTDKESNLLAQIYNRVDKQNWAQTDADDLIDDWTYYGELNKDRAKLLKTMVSEYIEDK